jgi:hypothetical protein
LFELCLSYPDDAVKVILDIIEQKPNEPVLHQLGAGAIEGLLFRYPECLEKLIAFTSNVDALKKCLLYVEYDNDDKLDKDVLEKFLNS